MSRFRYEIDSKKAIRIWDSELEQPEPFFYQPDWPNGTPWANKAEAESWAKALIESLQNPNYGFLPGDGPDQPLKPRPLPEPEIVDEATE